MPLDPQIQKTSVHGNYRIGKICFWFLFSISFEKKKKKKTSSDVRRVRRPTKLVEPWALRAFSFHSFHHLHFHRLESLWLSMLPWDDYIWDWTGFATIFKNQNLKLAWVLQTEDCFLVGIRRQFRRAYAQTLNLMWRSYEKLITQHTWKL